MTRTGSSRLAAFIAVCLAAVFLLATQIAAQPAGAVDCGNGFYCPRGNASEGGAAPRSTSRRVACAYRTANIVTRGFANTSIGREVAFQEHMTIARMV